MPACKESQTSTVDRVFSMISSRYLPPYLGHNYILPPYLGHNYILPPYLGHNYILPPHLGHNYILPPYLAPHTTVRKEELKSLEIPHVSAHL